MIGISKIAGRPALTKLFGLQVARALAAVSVVIAHALHQLDLLKIPVSNGWIRGFPWHFGVDLFFVLSGFLMWATVAYRVDAPGAWFQFLIRRIVRIGPIYWLYTLLLTGIILVFPSVVNTTELSLSKFIQSMLFIPYQIGTGKYRPILMQGWTLNYEMYFYAIMTLALGLFQRRVVLALTLFFSTTSLIFALVPLPARVEFWANPICLEFVFGLHLARIYLAGFRLHLAWGLVIVPLAMALLMISTGEPEEGAALFRFVKLGLPAALIVGWFAMSEPGRVGWLWKRLSPIGDSSYSLYLAHPFVLVAMSIAIRKLNLVDLPIAALVAGYVLACVVAGHVSYVLMERPMIVWFGNRLVRHSPRSLPREKPEGAVV